MLSSQPVSASIERKIHSSSLPSKVLTDMVAVTVLAALAADGFRSESAMPAAVISALRRFTAASSLIIRSCEVLLKTSELHRRQQRKVTSQTCIFSSKKSAAMIGATATAHHRRAPPRREPPRAMLATVKHMTGAYMRTHPSCAPRVPARHANPESPRRALLGVADSHYRRTPLQRKIWP